MTHDAGNLRFCPHCATELARRTDGLRERLACPSCSYIYYHNPVPAAGGVILRDDRICLVRRSIEPRRGDWSLPAGFVEYDESPADCARREIAEETGLEVQIDGVFGVYAGFDDPRQHAILIIYRTSETSTRTPVAGDDADDVAFFSVDQLPSNIAFRAHYEALHDVYGDRYEIP